MNYELIIIAGGIVLGLVGFLIGVLLVRRAYKQSPSILHYKKIVDILTLRKLHNRLYTEDIISGAPKLKTGQDHIEHYESMRDKLTLRKKPQVSVSSEGGSGVGMLGNLIGGFVVIFIGVALLGPVAQQVGQASQQMNTMNATTPSTQMAETMLKMVPAFFAIAIIGIVIAVIFSAFRTAGTI
jgi:hypothetical protein